MYQFATWHDMSLDMIGQYTHDWVLHKSIPALVSSFPLSNITTSKIYRLLLPSSRIHDHASHRFIFSDAPIEFLVSPFMQSLLGIWALMCRSLIQRLPQLIEEMERQPLIWNQWVRD